MLLGDSLPTERTTSATPSMLSTTIFVSAKASLSVSLIYVVVNNILLGAPIDTRNFESRTAEYVVPHHHLKVIKSNATCTVTRNVSIHVKGHSHSNTKVNKNLYDCVRLTIVTQQYADILLRKDFWNSTNLLKSRWMAPNQLILFVRWLPRASKHHHFSRSFCQTVNLLQQNRGFTHPKTHSFGSFTTLKRALLKRQPRPVTLKSSRRSTNDTKDAWLLTTVKPSSGMSFRTINLLTCLRLNKQLKCRRRLPLENELIRSLVGVLWRSGRCIHCMRYSLSTETQRSWSIFYFVIFRSTNE